MSISSDICEKFRLELAEKFEPYGWKYLKSGSLKKKVKDIVFEVYMGTSWHNSSKSARIRMGLISYCKSISRKDCQDSSVMIFKFVPSHGNDWEWWQIITPEEYQYAIADASDLFARIVIPLTDCFEQDYEGTVRDIAMNGYSDPNIVSSSLKKNTSYCSVQFSSHTLGKKFGQQVAMKRYHMMSDQMKTRTIKAIQEYRDNAEKAHIWRSKGLYFVDSEVMYMVDNKMIELSDDETIIFPDIE